MITIYSYAWQWYCYVLLRYSCFWMFDGCWSLHSVNLTQQAGKSIGSPLTMVSFPQWCSGETQRNGTILHVYITSKCGRVVRQGYSRNACWGHGYVMFSLATIFGAANNVCVCGKMMIDGWPINVVIQYLPWKYATLMKQRLTGPQVEQKRKNGKGAEQQRRRNIRIRYCGSSMSSNK